MVGPYGVRVVCLRTLANLDSCTIMDSMAAANFTMEQSAAQFADSTFLKTTAGVSDTAKSAVLLASDSARMWTATVVSQTAGAAPD
jgi:hypothetical protein